MAWKGCHYVGAVFPAADRPLQSQRLRGYVARSRSHAAYKAEDKARPDHRNVARVRRGNGGSAWGHVQGLGGLDAADSEAGPSSRRATKAGDVRQQANPSVV